MNIRTLLLAAMAAVAASAMPLVANAQTVDARCDIYPLGEDRASSTVSCTFSQRQGNVRIVRADGVTYDLTATGAEPDSYIDQNGRAAYRQAGLGDRGQIYQTATETVYVYWDTSGLSHSTDTSNPITYTTQVDANHIIIQVSDGSFYFHQTLTQLVGPDYSGSDGQVRVVYTPSSGRVYIFRERTGETLYDYTINPTAIGEDPSTMCNPALEPC